MLTINRKELLAKLSLVSAGLADKESVAQSMSFIFDMDRIYTFTGYLGICTSFNSGLKCAVPGQIFLSFLRKIKQDEVELKIEDGQLIVSGGKKARAKITVDAKITLPFDEHIKPPAKLTRLPFNPEQLSEGAKSVMFTVCNDTQTMQLCCMHIGNDDTGIFVETTDRTRITRRYISDKAQEIDLMILSEYVKTVCSLEPREYGMDNGWLYFKCANDTIMACTYPSAQYPDLLAIRKSNEKSNAVKVTFPTSVDRILDLANDFAVDTSLSVNGQVIVTVEEERARFFVKGDHGVFSEKCKVKNSGSCKFAIHPKKLAELLLIDLNAKVSESVIIAEGSCDKLPFWHLSVLNKLAVKEE